MVALSTFQHFRVEDDRRVTTSLLDLSVDLTAGNYPPVTHLLYRRSDRNTGQLPWQAVTDVDWRHHRIRVADLAAGLAVHDALLDGSVLLVRDILDALVLDLPQRQAMRANDLWLEDVDGLLRLQAADVSPWAVVRRLTGGLLGSVGQRDLLDWKGVEFLRGNPATARSGGDYHRRVASLPPAAIARLTDQIPYLHAAELLTLLPDQLASDVLEAMVPERQVQVFEELDFDRGLRVIDWMAPDLAADLVGHLDLGLARRILERLPEGRSRQVTALLRFPMDTAGGIMTNDLVTVPASLTAGEARQAIRSDLARPDFVYYVYVVESEDTPVLRGVLTLRDLLSADDSQPVVQIMLHDLQAIAPTERAVDAARQVAEQHLAALPVVDHEGRLLGAVTVDAAMLQIAPPTWWEVGPRVFS